MPQCLPSVRPLFVPVLTSRVVSLFLPGGLPPSLPLARTALALASLVALPPMRPPRAPIFERYSLTVLGTLLISSHAD